METYFSNINVSKRHFVILGKTTDQFCNSALMLQSLEETLHSHLSKKLGYQRIIFYSPTLMLYCMDEDSYRYTEGYGVVVQPSQPPAERQERPIKLGPLSASVPNESNMAAEKNNNKSKTWNLGKMNSAGAIRVMDKYMTDVSIKTALIITDTDFFITSFREVESERGAIDITREVQAKLSNWDRNRRPKDKNIVVWIFQKGNTSELAERLKGNVIWERFFIPMFKEKAEKREGTLIDIPTAGSGEIKNLINYYRLMDEIPVDMTFMNTAALELEKLTRGQSAFPDDNYKMIDMVGLGSLILDTKDIGGINMKNIESICGKNDRVSAFTKIEELSGMEDFKRTIDELKKIIKNSDFQKDTEIVYKDRLMRHPLDYRKETFNLHISLVGNPGTGKSTVAKLMGEVYFELGLLSTGHVIKVTRDDLVAGYIGQTAIKTKERINEAIGGVLFIDEAYTLARGGESDYGQEAIDTILEAMTDKMGEFAVIIAGYPDEIEMLLQKNPGFKSRFFERIKIEDYTAKELKDIFIKDIEKNDLKIGNDLLNVLEDFMRRYYDGTPRGKGGEWANARTVITLSKKMRDRCKVENETVVDIKHVPYELKKYLEETKSSSTLPKKITDSQLRLPSVDILKQINEIDIKKMEQAVLFIENKNTKGEVFYGTGFMITPNGHFITCNHVIKDAQEINARVRIIANGHPEDTIYKCELMNTFKDLDIALLKLDGRDLPYLNLEKNLLFEFEKGKNVCLSGYPFGQRTAEDCTYTEGKIASTRTENELECINLDISGKCGNSGGPVIDKKTGNVIGVFIGSITEGQGLVEEINYMRPIKYFLKEFVR